MKRDCSIGKNFKLSLKNVFLDNGSYQILYSSAKLPKFYLEKLRQRPLLRLLDKSRPDLFYTNKPNDTSLDIIQYQDVYYHLVIISRQIDCTHLGRWDVRFWRTAGRRTALYNTGKLTKDLHPLSERLAALGIMWAPSMASFNPSIRQSCDGPRSFRGCTQLGTHDCRETPASRTAVRLIGVVFPA